MIAYNILMCKEQNKQEIFQIDEVPINDVFLVQNIALSYHERDSRHWDLIGEKLSVLSGLS